MWKERLDLNLETGKERYLELPLRYLELYYYPQQLKTLSVKKKFLRPRLRLIQKEQKPMQFPLAV